MTGPFRAVLVTGSGYQAVSVPNIHRRVSSGS